MLKNKSNYEVITEAVELSAGNPKALKTFIESLYAFSLKGLSKRKDRDIKILLSDIQALGQSNHSYSDWQNEYNLYNAAQYDVFLVTDKNFAGTVKEMRGVFRGGKKKSYKRAKKVTTRLYKDIRKVCIDNKITPNKHKEFCVALRTGFFAYREAIINVRRRLPFELYQLIPATLHIYKDGKKLIIRDVYKEFNTNNGKVFFQLDSSINFSKDDLRSIQLELYPYIFTKVYKTIRF